MNESLSSTEAILQFLSVLITAFLLAAALNYARKGGVFKGARKVKRHKTPPQKSENKSRFIALWEKVLSYAKRGDEDGLRLAIIEADKILDEALSVAGINGLDTGDRLKKLTKDQFPEIDGVWQVHKLRNRLTHQADFHLPKELAREALKIYERALRSLKVLD